MVYNMRGATCAAYPKRDCCKVDDKKEPDGSENDTAMVVIFGGDGGFEENVHVDRSEHGQRR